MEKEDKAVIIIDTSAMAQVASEVLAENGQITFGFLSEEESEHNTELLDAVVLGSPKDDGYLKYIGQKSDVFVGYIEPDKRKEYTEFLKKRRKVTSKNVFHAKSTLSKSATFGHGVLINAGSIIQPNCEIGDGVFVQSNSVIETNTVLGAYCNVGSLAVIGNNSKIGGGTIIGNGVVIMPNTVIGKNCYIAPGSMVFGKIGDNKKIHGNPAKEM
jgi:sugar O-acyltransferase (sialic acid O-acetyltransferase NeuD family)